MIIPSWLSHLVQTLDSLPHVKNLLVRCTSSLGVIRNRCKFPLFSLISSSPFYSPWKWANQLQTLPPLSNFTPCYHQLAPHLGFAFTFLYMSSVFTDLNKKIQIFRNIQVRVFNILPCEIFNLSSLCLIFWKSRC